jgi:phosphoglycerol transferase MdoB-like AlkP superfamily enzyme
MKEMGYSTAFFHGGNNGSMKFNSFSRRCGFDTYYGRDEYPEPNKDFDGTWGIWDHKYFQYVANKMNEMPEPFCTGLFTLSSHNPFKVPDELDNKFPKDANNPILHSMAYADYSLRKFFETASKMKWFDNTIFVIVGDHTAWNTDLTYSGDAGAFELPMLFYMPGKLKGNVKFPTQQVDILPTILNMAGYEGKVAAFGRSILTQDSTAKTFMWLNNNFLLANKNIIIKYNGNKLLSAYNYNLDRACTDNILVTKQQEAEQMKNYLKAVMQTYNEGLLKNKLFPTQP